MSLNDINLKDAHLQKALRHASDNDAAPSNLTRKAILDYAEKAIGAKHRAQQNAWFVRVKNLFSGWQISSWQLTGMGSLAASLLVVVMIWHENPDDPLQVDASTAKMNEQGEVSEKYDTKIAQADLAAPEAPDNAPNKAEAKLVAKEKLAKQQSSKQQLPQQQAIENQTDSLAASESRVVASAPAQVTAPAATNAEIATEASAAAASEQATGMASPPATKKMATAEAAAEQTQADQSQPAVAVARAAKPYLKEEMNLAQRISKEGGKATAEKDIAAGNLRILVLNKQAAQTDEASGYSIVLIADEAPNVAAETAVYNQTMRDWHKQTAK